MYGTLAHAGMSFSTNIKLTTDYVVQGVSDSDGAPAIQGGFDWSHSTGPYAGVWASSVASGGGIEIDYCAGL